MPKTHATSLLLLAQGVLLTVSLLPTTVFANAGATAEAVPHAVEPINWFDFGAWWSDGASPPFVAVLINFAVLCWIVYIILKPGLVRRFAGRREAVTSALEEAARIKAAAEAAMADASARSAALATELATLKEQILAGGKAEADRLIKEAEERAARMRRDAELLLVQEMSTLRTELRAELVEAVVASAERHLREKLVSSDQERLTQEYLEAIGFGSRVSRPPTARP